MASGTINASSGKFAVVRGTLSSISGDWIYIAYPNGYNVNNCIVIGKMIETATNEWFDFPYSMQGNLYCGCALTSASIQVSTNDGNMLGKNIRVVLMRTDL